MTNHLDLMKCPLCEGQGDVRRYRLIQFFSDPELQAKIAGYLGNDVPDVPETASVLAGPPAETRDFQKEVHRWNPEVPLWRRSPKE